MTLNSDIDLFTKNVRSFIIRNLFESQAFLRRVEELNIPSVNCHVALIAESLTRFSALDIYQFIVERMRVLVSPTNSDYNIDYAMPFIRNGALRYNYNEKKAQIRSINRLSFIM